MAPKMGTKTCPFCAPQNRSKNLKPNRWASHFSTQFGGQNPGPKMGPRPSWIAPMFSARRGGRLLSRCPCAFAAATPLSRGAMPFPAAL